MIQDPIVEEVHRIREKLSRKFQFDIQKIFEDVKQRERQHRDRIVNLRVKLIKITSEKDETQEAV
ncbi:MAG: hypothetical protein PVH61_02830 [Candidatus Aminicenantes bacterium]|jgi:hypothetical protein